jgi:hypothetical protein
VPPVPADAAKCIRFTDAGLTRSNRSLPSSIEGIADDLLLTVAGICAILQIGKSVVYAACDSGDLEYVKFEGAIQVEGRDLKEWFDASKPSGST